MRWDWGHAREEYLWIGALLALTTLAFVVASCAGYAGGVPAHRVTFAYAKIIWMMGPAAIFLASVPLAIRAVVLRIPSPLKEAAPFVKERFGTPALAAGSLAPIILMPILMGSFGTLKMLMPLVAPFQ